MFTVRSSPFLRQRQPVVLVTPISDNHLLRLTSLVALFLSIGFIVSATDCLYRTMQKYHTRGNCMRGQKESFINRFPGLCPIGEWRKNLLHHRLRLVPRLIPIVITPVEWLAQQLLRVVICLHGSHLCQQAHG